MLKNDLILAIRHILRTFDEVSSLWPNVFHDALRNSRNDLIDQQNLVRGKSD